MPGGPGPASGSHGDGDKAMGMFDFLLRKQRLVEQSLLEYLDQWEKCLTSFKTAVDVYFEKGLGEEFDFCVEATHKMESHADDLRRKIEWDMYSKALIPESRGDILGFLESMDRIPNKAESILYQIQTQKTVVPKELHGQFKRVINLSCECMELVHEASLRLFKNEPKMLELTDQIDRKESECDHAERNLITSIFEMEIETGDKIVLKELVIEFGTLTDRAENVSDRLTIQSVKRRV
jgi:predicted phosphate transport protein (TIGR00153 family)